MIRKVTLHLLLGLVIVLGSTFHAFGQAVSGSLLGTVQDSSGATVAKAAITAVETNTGTTYQSVTNDAGNYTIPSLPPGR